MQINKIEFSVCNVKIIGSYMFTRYHMPFFLFIVSLSVYFFWLISGAAGPILTKLPLMIMI